MKSLLTFAASAAVALAMVVPDSPTGPRLADVENTVPESAKDIFVSDDIVRAPLLLAGNTACNPRVTVCEE